MLRKGPIKPVVPPLEQAELGQNIEATNPTYSPNTNNSEYVTTTTVTTTGSNNYNVSPDTVVIEGNNNTNTGTTGSTSLFDQMKLNM